MAACCGSAAYSVSFAPARFSTLPALYAVRGMRSSAMVWAIVYALCAAIMHALTHTWHWVRAQGPRRAAPHCLRMKERDDTDDFYGDLTSNAGAGVLVCAGVQRVGAMMCVWAQKGVSARVAA